MPIKEKTWIDKLFEDMVCGDCKWKGKRHQKCSCCARNQSLKDNYEKEDNNYASKNETYTH